MKNRLGGTLNDVVLATVAGAVRRFLERQRVNCEHIDFRVMAPVSVRTRGRARRARQSRLGVDRAHAARRARPAPPPRARSARPPSQLKETKQALGAEVLAAGRRVDAVDDPLARLAHGDARPALQPGRHQRARPAGAALHARRAHARQLRLRAAHRRPLPRHRAVQLRRASSAGASPASGTCCPTCTTSSSTSRRRSRSCNVLKPRGKSRLSRRQPRPGG